VREALCTTFIQTNNYCRDSCVSQFPTWKNSGSTANVAGIYKENNEEYWVTLANTGDSRAILSIDKNIVLETVDHKPDSPEERKRVEGAGGFVTHFMGDTARVNGVLAMSRAFGDFTLTPVIADPYLSDFCLGTMKEGTIPSVNLIIASDGLWDVLSSEEVAEKVANMRKRGLRPHEISKALVAEAFEKFSHDNITVLTLFVDDFILSIKE